MGFTWGVCSRLTLKRQHARREEVRPLVADLGMIIRATQREAAALPTAELRDEIEINLEVQDTAIRYFYDVTGPDGGTVDDWIVVTNTVMVSFVMTALYVSELTARPRDTWTITASVN